MKIKHTLLIAAAIILIGGLVVAGTTNLDDLVLSGGITAVTSTFTGASTLDDINASGKVKIGSGTPTTTQTDGSVYATTLLEVDGVARFDGAIDANSTSDFSGAMNLQDGLTVAGVPKFDGAIDANSTSDFQGAMNLQAGITVAGVSKLDGAIDANSTSNFEGIMTLQNDLIVGGHTISLDDGILSFVPPLNSSGYSIGEQTQISSTGETVLKLEQETVNKAIMHFAGTSDSGYIATFSTTPGDGAVVGPKAASSADGWTFQGMFKVILGTDTVAYVPLFVPDPL